MQEAVRNNSDGKSLFSVYLDVLDAKEKQARNERELQEQKYLMRTQRIYELHDRQRSEASELRRCLQYVSQHALALDTALRGAGAGDGAGAGSGALLRQAAALQRVMLQCVHNARAVRDSLHNARAHHMDALLVKMENEVRAWSSFVSRAADACADSEALRDNLHNLIAEQRRCVSEVTSSEVYATLCGDPDGIPGEREGEGSDDSETSDTRPVSNACSTPISRH